MNEGRIRKIASLFTILTIIFVFIGIFPEKVFAETEEKPINPEEIVQVESFDAVEVEKVEKEESEDLSVLEDEKESSETVEEALEAEETAERLETGETETEVTVEEENPRTVTKKLREIASETTDLFTQLKEKIAGMEEAKEEVISLKGGEYIFTETLELAGKHIILEAQNPVVFKRDKAFKDTMISIGPGGYLNLNSNQIVFDGEGKNVSCEEKRGTFIHTKGHLEINGAIFRNESGEVKSTAPIFGYGSDAEIVFNSGLVEKTNFFCSSRG